MDLKKTLISPLNSGYNFTCNNTESQRIQSTFGEYMSSFSDYAQQKLIDLYENHSHEVGIKLKESDPVKYKDYESTDCITYALNVISFAFKSIGNDDAAKKSWSLGKFGTELAKYLVDIHSWKGIYINPDVNHPSDSDSEHSYSHHLALKKCEYYKIPLDYKVTNYDITPKTSKAFGTLNKSKGLTALNSIDISSLELVKFGFGVSRGGQHTWLFSLGKVYEVHWDEIGSNLYEASPLRTYPWLSGAIVIPLDQASLLVPSTKLKCK